MLCFFCHFSADLTGPPQISGLDDQGHEVGPSADSSETGKDTQNQGAGEVSLSKPDGEVSLSKPGGEISLSKPGGEVSLSKPDGKESQAKKDRQSDNDKESIVAETEGDNDEKVEENIDLDIDRNEKSSHGEVKQGSSVEVRQGTSSGIGEKDCDDGEEERGTKSERERNADEEEDNENMTNQNGAKSIKIEEEEGGDATGKSEQGTSSNDASVTEGHSCFSCGIWFRSKHTLLQHLSNWHEELAKSAKHECKLCDFTTTRSSIMQTHFTSHQKDKQNKCRMCNKAFITAASLKTHLLKIHQRNVQQGEKAEASGEKKYSCLHCGHGFDTVSALRYHENKHTSEHQCDCGKFFATKGSLQTHVKNNHGKTKHECPFCHCKCVSEQTLEKHMTKCSFEGSSLGSEMSSPVRKSRRRMKPTSEVITSSLSLSFPCPVCDGLFLEMTALEAHLEEFHPSWDKKYKCGSCRFTSSDTEVIMLHFQAHRKVAAAQEGIESPPVSKQEGETETDQAVAEPVSSCHNYAKTNEDVPEAVEGKEENKNEQEEGGEEKGQKDDGVKCNECPFSAQDVRELNMHTGNHSGAKPFACSECGLRYLRVDKIKLHMQGKHESPESELCLVCGQCFRDTQALGEHEEEGHGEGCHKCDRCGTAFSNTILLKRHKMQKHIRWHKGTLKGLRNMKRKHNSKSCPECPMGFTGQSALDKHLVAAHPDAEADLLCDLCGGNFEGYAALQRHMDAKKQRCSGLPGYLKTKAYTRPQKQSARSIRDLSKPKSFKCNVCDFSARRIGDLNFHILRHTGVKPFFCNQCNYRCLLQVVLKGHFRKKHNSTDPHLCNYCGEGFVDEAAFKAHEAEGHGDACFKCEMCDKPYGTKDMLQRHIGSAHEKKTFVCKHCEFESDRIEGLKEHTQENHKELEDEAAPEKEQRLFQCHLCTFSARRIGDLNYHVLWHTGLKPFFCGLCDYRNLLKPSLRRHLLVKHEAPEPSICSYCGQGCLDKDSFSTHEATGHTEHFPCEICNRMFGSQDMLKRHMDGSHKEKLFYCNVCGYHAATQYALKAHKSEQNHVLETKASFKCEKCNATFVRHGSFKMHMKWKHGDGPMCEFCSKRFCSEQKLSNHVRIVHITENQLSCEHCGRLFRSKKMLMKHILTHTGIRPYKCDVCHKRYTSANYLKEHRRLHTGERKYVCAVCGRGFDHMSHVKVHMRIHTGEKPCICEICGQGFRTNNILKRHAVIHNPVKELIQCYICEKTFSTNNVLLKHLRNIHKDATIYPCQLCNERFSTRAALHEHGVVHIKEETLQVENSQHIEAADGTATYTIIESVVIPDI